MEQAQNPTREMSEDVKKFGDSAEDAGHKALKTGDIINANLISEAIIGGVKALGSAFKQLGDAAIEVGNKLLEGFAV